MWFKDASEGKSFPPETLHDLVQEYINRNSGEIKELKANHRQGRPKASRLILLENLLSKDRQDYKQSGIDAPNLNDTETFEFLSKWNGDYNSISNIKMVRVKEGETQFTTVDQEMSKEDE